MHGKGVLWAKHKSWSSFITKEKERRKPQIVGLYAVTFLDATKETRGVECNFSSDIHGILLSSAGFAGIFPV